MADFLAIPMDLNEHNTSDKFLAPAEADVVTPNADGVTGDPTGCLDTALTWNADGSVTCTMTATTAETLPNRGWFVILPWRDSDGNLADRTPAAFAVHSDTGTPPSDSSGLVVWAGLSTDAAGTSIVWSGLDWDGAGARANAGLDGAVALSGVRGGLKNFGATFPLRRGVLGTDGTVAAVTTVLENANGSVNTSAAKTMNLALTGQTWLCFGVFPHAASATATITFSPTAWIRQIEIGGLA